MKISDYYCRKRNNNKNLLKNKNLLDNSKNHNKHIKLKSLNFLDNRFAVARQNIDGNYDSVAKCRCKVSTLDKYTLFFIRNTVINQARLKLAKNQANAKQHPEADLLAIHIPHPRYAKLI